MAHDEELVINVNVDFSKAHESLKRFVADVTAALSKPRFETDDDDDEATSMQEFLQRVILAWGVRVPAPNVRSLAKELDGKYRIVNRP